MNENVIINRIHHFFYKLIPQTKLSKKFSSDCIHLLIKEGVSVSRLGDLDLVKEMKDLDPEITVENALEEALNSLLENLRFGKSQSSHLKEALRIHVPEENVNKYMELIDKRIAAREDYLFACSLLQESRQKEEVKAYLLLNQLILVHRINPGKLDAHIKYLCQRKKSKEDNLLDADLERRKLISILSLDVASQYAQIILHIIDSVSLDFEFLRKLNSWSLLKSLKQWPVFRLKVFNAMNRQLAEADSLQDIEQIAAFIQSTLHSGPSKNNNQQSSSSNDNGAYYELKEVLADLFRSLDGNINVSRFYKTELMNYLHVGLFSSNRAIG